MDAITFSALFRSFRRACGGIVATHVGFWTSENACVPAAHSLQSMTSDAMFVVMRHVVCFVVRNAQYFPAAKLKAVTAAVTTNHSGW